MPAGSLTIFRWHARTCPYRTKGRRWPRGNCGIWVQGSFGGEWVKRSLNTHDWGAATAIVDGSRRPPARSASVKTKPTIQRALELYFEDAVARHPAGTTIRKRRELLEGKLLPFCEGKGISLLKQLDVLTLRRSEPAGNTRRFPP